MKKLALALATLAPLALAGSAQAKDLKGRFGLGGQVDSGLAGGLSLKYWISDLGLQAVIGFAFDAGKDPDGEAGPLDATSLTDFRIGIRALYNFARANDTNMYGGAGVSLSTGDVSGGHADMGLGVQINLLLGVEHFFTDYFSVAGHVGLDIDLPRDEDTSNSTSDDSSALTIDLNSISWGTSFHFYF